MITVKRVSKYGFEVLRDLAINKPGLFIDPNTSLLIEEMQSHTKEELWDGDSIRLSETVNELNTLTEKGPGSDAKYSQILRRAMGPILHNDIADNCYWASLNCFALAHYTTVRWSFSGGKLVETNPPRFVLKHWLENDREGNAAMRLWWLGEIASRTAERSHRYTADAMLEAMSKHVNLYHQTLDRTNLIPNWRLNAMIWEHALNGKEHLFTAKNASDLLRSLNLRAATVSLDLMDDEQLRELVKEATPVPKA